MAKAKREKWLQIRMSDEEVAMLDELTAHFEAEDRATLVRQMVKDFRAKMNRDRAKRAKEAAE